MTSSTTTDKCVDRDGCRLACDFQLLRHAPVFSAINLEVVKLFAYLSSHRSYRSGDYLIEQGSTASTAFILIEGVVEITIRHKDREIVLQQLGKDAFFGELALLAQYPWYFSARAKGPAEVLIISRTAFQKVLDKYPAYRDKLIERIIQLRVDRLASQTTALLDRFTDNAGMPAPTLL